MVDTLNTMVEEVQLTPSLHQRAIRLIPKVKGGASQLRPITLVNNDYKLLMKGCVNRLLQVLQGILK